jgi:hypothetical protein
MAEPLRQSTARPASWYWNCTAHRQSSAVKLRVLAPGSLDTTGVAAGVSLMHVVEEAATAAWVPSRLARPPRVVQVRGGVATAVVARWASTPSAAKQPR